MRILYVDDNEMNRCVVRAMLSTAQVEMDEACDGAAGLEMVERGDYDLVLMDLRMPVMDGLTAIGHLRRRDDDKANVPVVVLTADTGPDIRDTCLAQGADEILLKPVMMQALFDALGRVVVRTSPQSARLA